MAVMRARLPAWSKRVPQLQNPIANGLGPIFQLFFHDGEVLDAVSQKSSAAADVKQAIIGRPASQGQPSLGGVCGGE
jgi:hypothetical protein